MENIRKILEIATKGICYDSYRYCADEEMKVPTINYEETQTFTLLKDRYGETDTSLKQTKDLSIKAKQISDLKPLFHFFLDGSRRTYKVDDIEINKRIFPIMAGQIGVACCERINPNRFTCKELENNLVISLPIEANPETKNTELFNNNLKEKINNTPRVKKIGLKFSNILSYSSKANNESKELKYEHLGIAAIQD